MEKIIIIGGEGTSANIAEAIIDAIENHGYKAELLGFANDYIEKKEIMGINIVTTIKDISKLFHLNDIKFIFSLYKPNLMIERTALLKSLDIPHKQFTNFFHPKSYISKSAKFGIGNVVLANCTIQNNTNIGSFNIINSNVVIEHDTKIGNSNFIAASAVTGSNVSIGNSCFIGLNASIREQIIIQNNVFLGMNSLLLKNCSNNEIWYGNPAVRK